MAHYQTEFSFVLPMSGDAERAWATRLIAAIEGWDAHTPAGWLDQLLGSDFGYIGIAASLEEDGLWLHSGSSGDVHHAIRVTQDYLATFRPTEAVGIAWAETCNAPRTDAFGGGAVRITATDVQSITTASWLQQRSGVVTVPYTIPLCVDVDLDTGEVKKVRPINDNLERDEPLGVRDALWNEIHDQDVRERAIAIAEEACWPAWEIGA